MFPLSCVDAHSTTHGGCEWELYHIYIYMQLHMTHVGRFTNYHLTDLPTSLMFGSSSAICKKADGASLLRRCRSGNHRDQLAHRVLNSDIQLARNKGSICSQYIYIYIYTYLYIHTYVEFLGTLEELPLFVKCFFDES